MKTLLFLLLVIGVVIFVGCKAKQSVTEVDPKDSAFPPLDERLHDIWVLISLDGQALERTSSRPRLELFPGEGRIAGNGGCNELFGQMDGQGEEVVFLSVGTTKMFCRDLMEMENNFLTRLQEVNQYRIKDLKLYLYNGKKETLVFQKVD